jgi:hypothetical protein
MVWACVAHNYKSPLIVFPSRMKDEDGQPRTFRLDAPNYRCLATVVPELHKRKLILQQDGARSHVAKRTKAYLAKKKLPYLKNWPPYSPDLNMIEPLWKELNCRIGVRCPQSHLVTECDGLGVGVAMLSSECALRCEFLPISSGCMVYLFTTKLIHGTGLSVGDYTVINS